MYFLSKMARKKLSFANRSYKDCVVLSLSWDIWRSWAKYVTGNLLREKSYQRVCQAPEYFCSVAVDTYLAKRIYRLYSLFVNKWTLTQHMNVELKKLCVKESRTDANANNASIREKQENRVYVSPSPIMSKNNNDEIQYFQKHLTATFHIIIQYLDTAI